MKEPRESPASAGEPSLPLGFLAALPLYAAYEVGLAASAELPRNGAERALFLAVDVLGLPASALRITALLLASVLCVRCARRSGADLGRALRATWSVGLLAGLVLGPALVLAGALAGPGATFDVPAGRPAAPPGLARALRLAGGAGWEELLFRVALLGLVYLLVFRSAAFLGMRASAGRALADVAAILGSALAFAAFHLAPVQRELGLAGDAFAAPVFLWRILAGIALGALFRWRGLGVAAWAHGLLNLGLALGAGPGVFGSG